MHSEHASWQLFSDTATHEPLARARAPLPASRSPFLEPAATAEWEQASDADLRHVAAPLAG
ncbi:hypothetical protein ACIQBJ_06335 [Kitasatospora sp. NPDC088391]|uniref:hypothetical protein n=1 Tax=Kitasatospora sp. NPDC088391 TaxID=3364074 RepID=UPI00381F8ED9